MSLEERIASVEDRDQIRETIARYAHGLDLPDRDVFASVWTPDAVYRVDEPFGEVRGIEAITAAWDTFQTIFIDMHHHTMNVIVDGPDGDRASSVSFALVTGTDSEGTAWTSSCIYYDQFQKIDGQWLFTERYDKVNYMVPWLAPLGLDENARIYVSPDVIQRLIAAGEARRAAASPA
jgi:ketosteroid isomerase-like protein